MAALLRLENNERMLLTVEVKYIDSFSRARLDYDRYADHLAQVGLDAESTEALVSGGASQFLRSLLLTDSVRRRGVRGDSGVEHALAVVLARGDDKTAKKVVAALAKHPTATKVAYWSHEKFFDAAERHDDLASWARSMRRRYVL